MKLPLFQSVVYTAMLCLFLWPAAQAQVSINETNADPDPSAMLDVQSIDKGVLLPRMTTDEMNAIVDPAPGLLIFNEETQSYWHRDATQWCEISAGAVPPAGLLLNKDDCYLDTTLIAQALCEYPGFGPSCIGGGFTTTSIWQSFTAAEGGSLTVVGVDVSDFEMTNPGDDFLLSLEVYTGEGTSGTLLYQSDPLAIPALGYFYFAIPYETVALSQGSMYTLNCVPLTTGLDGWGWNQEDTNIYDGGRSSYGANQDQEFEVYVTNCNTRYLVQPRSERGFVNLSSVDTLFFADGTYTTTGINALIRDTDGDTKVTAEQSPDEDQVRIFLKDEESFTFSPGQIGLLNNFSTVAIGGNIDLGDRENNSYNTLLGQGAGNLLTGRENTFLGYLTGSEFNGYNNVAVGPVAGFDAVGNNNLYLGNYAGYSVSGSNNVFLGQRAGYSHNGSNQLFIENSDAGPAAALIYGEFDNDFLRINGTLNLNGAFAFPTTDGTTGQVLETDGAGNVSWGNKTLDTDDQTIDQLSLNGTTLEISLENDGQAVQTLDLAGINSVQTLLEDADQDTRISVEPSPDADLVQMRIAGTDAFEFIDGKINLASANILIGSDVGNENLRTNASGNVIIGQQAGANSANPTRPETYGGANVFIGQGAGIGNYGDYNLLLGASTGIHLNGSYNIYMGKSVGLNQSESYRLRIGGYLGNTLLYGEFDNSLLQVNGTLNINNAFSFPIADGSTGQILQTDGSGNVSWGAKTIDTDDQTIDQLTLNGTTLELSLENDGQPTQTVDLAGIDTDTDDQTIDQLTLNGTTLELSLENDGQPTQTIDLASIDTNTDNQTIDQLTLNGTTLEISLEDDGQAVQSLDLASINSIQAVIEDTDNDTKIQVEEIADEDIIRFDVNGAEIAFMDGQTFHFTSPGNSLFIGSEAGQFDDGSSNSNTYVGNRAGRNTTVGENNTALGNQAFQRNSQGSRNTALGATAMFNNSSGHNNVGIGYNALFTNTSGDFNTAVGAFSLENMSGVNGNSAFGYQSMQSNTNGQHNTALGFSSLSSNSTGSENTAVGSGALQNSKSDNNTAVGRNALGSKTNGSDNAALGMQALQVNLTGSRNVALGAYAGRNNNGSQNVFLGYNAGLNETGSDKLYIENSSSVTPLVYGEFNNDLLQINGTLNISGAFSFPLIDGGAGQVLQTDGAGLLSWSDKTTDTDDQTIDQLTLNGTTLEISLEDDGQVAQTIDLASIDTDTDDQTIDLLNLNGTTLEISLEDDGQAAQTVDLASIDTDTDNQAIDLLNLNGTTLEISLEDDGQVAQTIDLASIDTDNQTIDQLTLNGTTLEISLQDDGQAVKTLDLTAIDTDEQGIDQLSLNGTTLEISLENDGQAVQTLDLAGINTTQSIIEDADADTKIQVEESPDEDVIRFDLAGYESLVISPNGSNNTLIEPGNATDGNTVLGQNAGYSLSGTHNVLIGQGAGRDAANSLANTYVGRNAGAAHTAGSNNTFLGYHTGRNGTGGSSNVYIGAQAGGNGSGSLNVFIGNSAGLNESGSNKLYIENSSSTAPLIYGEFNNNLARINGQFEVTGTTQLGSSGTAFNSVVTRTINFDLPNISSTDVHFQNFNVPGATTNSTVQVSAQGDLPGRVSIGQAYVVSANTVRVKFINNGSNGQNPSAMNFRFTVINH